MHSLSEQNELANALAVTREQKIDAYRIRYAAYSCRGFIPPNDTLLFSDEYDLTENCLTFLLLKGERAVGSIRACIHTGATGWIDVPAYEPFYDELHAVICKGSRFIELNRFVIDPAFNACRTTANFALFHNAVFVADQFDCEFMVGAVRDEHVGFYKLLHFELCSPKKRYPGTTFDTRLMIMNWRRAAPLLRQHRVFSGIERFRRLTTPATHVAKTVYSA